MGRGTRGIGEGGIRGREEKGYMEKKRVLGAGWGGGRVVGACWKGDTDTPLCID